MTFTLHVFITKDVYPLSSYILLEIINFNLKGHDNTKVDIQKEKENSYIEKIVKVLSLDNLLC